METHLPLNPSVEVGGSMKILVTFSRVPHLQVMVVIIDPRIVSMRVIMVLMIMTQVFSLNLRVLMGINTSFQRRDLVTLVIMERENTAKIISLGRSY